MKKETLFAISSYNQKYYFSPKSKNLPKDIILDIKKIGIYFANKIKGVFCIGFYENGDIFIECTSLENDFDYDEIGAKLEIERLKKEKTKLFSSLIIWNKILNQNRKDLKSES